jgi:cytoskeletal protein CcmA (bactofilin family)
VWGRKSASDQFNGFLDVGTCVTGELSFSGTLRLEGNVHGSIRTTDVLVIGEGAMVHAEITAGEVEIHGTVSGNITCERRLQIFSSGRLRGDVRVPTLIIDEGGVFEGISLGKNHEEKQLAKESAPKELTLIAKK